MFLTDFSPKVKELLNLLSRVVNISRRIVKFHYTHTLNLYFSNLLLQGPPTRRKTSKAGGIRVFRFSGSPTEVELKLPISSLHKEMYMNN